LDNLTRSQNVPSIRKNNTRPTRPGVRWTLSDNSEAVLTTPESKVKKQVVTLLNTYSVYYFYPVSGGFGRAGIPDVIACCNGRFIGIECKAGDNKTTELQRRELRKIQEAGGYSLVIRETNLQELESLLRYLTKQEGNTNEPKQPTPKPTKRHLRLCDAPAKD